MKTTESEDIATFNQHPVLHLTLGRRDRDHTRHVGLPCCPDSCGVVNVMHMSWAVGLLFNYPDVVAHVIDNRRLKEKHLRLAGFIGTEEELKNLTTKLTMILELETPYQKSKGGETLTVSFACGWRVSGNCILGVPFWREVGLSLNLEKG